MTCWIASWVVVGIVFHFLCFNRDQDVTIRDLFLIVLVGAIYGPMWVLIFLINMSGGSGRVIFPRRRGD